MQGFYRSKRSFIFGNLMQSLEKSFPRWLSNNFRVDSGYGEIISKLTQSMKKSFPRLLSLRRHILKIQSEFILNRLLSSITKKYFELSHLDKTHKEIHKKYFWETKIFALSFISYSVVSLHCKDAMPKIRRKYCQKRNWAAPVPISTFMYLWSIYIFPQSVCQFSVFCYRKLCGPILGL